MAKIKVKPENNNDEDKAPSSVIETPETETQESLEAKFSSDGDGKKDKPKVLIKGKKTFSLSDYKKEVDVPQITYKPDSWIPMSKAFMQTTQLPGIPEGRLTVIWGHEDTSKSTVALEAMAHAQKKGILPILINTEKKIDMDHVRKMGVDTDNWFYVDTLESAEECCEFIKDRLKDQKEGKLSTDILIVWDSIGNIVSKAELKADDKGETGAIMATAKILTQQIHRIIEKRISDTRKDTYPYNATMLIVNHAYQGTTQNVLTPAGGRGVLKAASLSIRMGGIVTNSTKCYAVKNGVEVAFAIKTAIVTIKNHVTNICTKSSIICTETGFILEEEIEKYKKDHKNSWDLKFDKDWTEYEK